MALLNVLKACKKKKLYLKAFKEKEKAKNLKGFKGVQ